MKRVKESVRVNTPNFTTSSHVSDDEEINACCGGLIKLAIFLQHAGKEAVSTDKGDKLTQYDRDDISSATEELLPTLRLLANEVFEPLRESDPQRCKDAYELTWRLVSVVTRLAGQVVVTDSLPNLYRGNFSKDAGRKSGAARSRRAQATWAPHATELTSKILASPRGAKLSKQAMINQIRAKWRSQHKIPSDATLTRFLTKIAKVED
jgi:hypothetical protein